MDLAFIFKQSDIFLPKNVMSVGRYSPLNIDTGSVLFPMTNSSSPLLCASKLRILKDNRRKELPQTSTMSKSLSFSDVMQGSPELGSSFRVTWSSPDRTQPSPTFGRKKRELQGLSSSSELSRSNAIKRKTGTLSENKPKKVTFKPFRPTYTYVVITSSEESHQIVQGALQSLGRATFIGEEAERESHDEHGTKLDWTLTVKIPEPNGGMVTKAKRMLLSMNFVVTSESRTYSDGLTAIQFEWRLKAPAYPCWRPNYGLLRTSILEPGTQT